VGIVMLRNVPGWATGHEQGKVVITVTQETKCPVPQQGVSA
jgi:hypothetical protein